MTHRKFEELLNETINEIHSRLGAKNKEYATDDDKLHNFKRAAQLDNITPIEALRGMELKHITSIRDQLDWLKVGRCTPLRVWFEKLIDEINYLILLYALLVEDSDETN